MKTTKIIKNKKEVMKELLTTMYESACAQKELLELLLEEFETEETNQAPLEVEPRELIKGVNGLAEFLGCGSTKAQNIINSGVLQEREIAYRAGNRWRFNKTLLTRLLDEEPEILNRVCSEAEAA
jgi:hypothetical protein